MQPGIIVQLPNGGWSLQIALRLYNMRHAAGPREALASVAMWSEVRYSF